MVGSYPGSREENRQLFGSWNVILMERSDKELVTECLEGSKRAFEELVDRYQRLIFNVAYRMVNDYDTAEDMT